MVRGRRRCRMHGGTNPGAPKGNRNAIKHGRKSAATLAMIAEMRALICTSRLITDHCKQPVTMDIKLSPAFHSSHISPQARGRRWS